MGSPFSHAPAPRRAKKVSSRIGSTTIPQLEIAAARQGEGDRELRIGVREVGRSVERIEVPRVLVVARSRLFDPRRRLLGDDQMIGEGAPQLPDDQVLDLAIRFRHQIDRPLVVDRLAPSPGRSQAPRPFRHGAPRHLLEGVHGGDDSHIDWRGTTRADGRRPTAALTRRRRGPYAASRNVRGRSLPRGSAGARRGEPRRAALPERRRLADPRPQAGRRPHAVRRGVSARQAGGAPLRAGGRRPAAPRCSRCFSSRR